MIESGATVTMTVEEYNELERKQKSLEEMQRAIDERIENSVVAVKVLNPYWKPSPAYSWRPKDEAFKEFQADLEKQLTELQLLKDELKKELQNVGRMNILQFLNWKKTFHE